MNTDFFVGYLVGGVVITLSNIVRTEWVYRRSGRCSRCMQSWGAAGSFPGKEN